MPLEAVAFAATGEAVAFAATGEASALVEVTMVKKGLPVQLAPLIPRWRRDYYTANFSYLHWSSSQG